MADLTWQEKRNLEAVLQMGGGYVLDFSNRTFHQFVTDCTGRNILGDDYEYATGSKANCLRAFWEKEPNELVGSRGFSYAQAPQQQHAADSQLEYSA